MIGNSPLVILRQDTPQHWTGTVGSAYILLILQMRMRCLFVIQPRRDGRWPGLSYRLFFMSVARKRSRGRTLLCYTYIWIDILYCRLAVFEWFVLSVHSYGTERKDHKMAARKEAIFVKTLKPIYKSDVYKVGNIKTLGWTFPPLLVDWTIVRAWMWDYSMFAVLWECYTVSIIQVEL